MSGRFSDPICPVVPGRVHPGLDLLAPAEPHAALLERTLHSLRAEAQRERRAWQIPAIGMAASILLVAGVVFQTGRRDATYPDVVTSRSLSNTLEEQAVRTAFAVGDGMVGYRLPSEGAVPTSAAPEGQLTGKPADGTVMIHLPDRDVLASRRKDRAPQRPVAVTNEALGAVRPVGVDMHDEVNRKTEESREAAPATGAAAGGDSERLSIFAIRLECALSEKNASAAEAFLLGHSLWSTALLPTIANVTETVP